MGTCLITSVGVVGVAAWELPSSSRMIQVSINVVSASPVDQEQQQQLKDT